MRVLAAIPASKITHGVARGYPRVVERLISHCLVHRPARVSSLFWSASSPLADILRVGSHAPVARADHNRRGSHTRFKLRKVGCEHSTGATWNSPGARLQVRSSAASPCVPIAVPLTSHLLSAVHHSRIRTLCGQVHEGTVVTSAPH